MKNSYYNLEFIKVCIQNGFYISLPLIDRSEHLEIFIKYTWYFTCILCCILSIKRGCFQNRYREAYFRFDDMAIISLRENKRCDEQLAQRLLYYLQFRDISTLCVH